MHTSIALQTPCEFINVQPLNPLISKCQIKVCWVGQQANRNKSIITKEVAKQMANSLPGSPIVGFFNEHKGDFEEHNQLAYAKPLLDERTKSFASETLCSKFRYMNTQFYFCSVKSALGYTGHGITEKNGAMYKDGRKITRVHTVMTGEEELTYERLMYICNLYKNTTAGNVYFN